MDNTTKKLKISLSDKYKIGFGIFATFLTSFADDEGVTYKCSKECVKYLKSEKRDMKQPIITILLNNEVIAVTEKEALKIGQKQIPCKWYQSKN